MSGRTTPLSFCSTGLTPSWLLDAGKKPGNSLLFLALPLLLIPLSFLLSPQPAFAATITVNGTAGQTIQDAIDAASSGDIIEILPGTYAEALTIQQDGISIIGVDRDDVIIDVSSVSGASGCSPPTGICILAENVTLQGFTVQGDGDTLVTRAIKISEVNGTVISDVKVEGIEGTGIDIINANDITLSDIEVVDNTGAGFFVKNTRGISFEDITTDNNSWGGIGLATDGDPYPDPTTTEVTFSGTNSFGELALGGIYLEVEDGGNPMNYSNDGSPADVQLQNSGVEFALHAIQDDTPTERVLFFDTLDNAITAGQIVPYGHLTGEGRYIEQVSANYLVVAAGMSIQAAIDASADGGTIEVQDGAYTTTGQALIDKNLSIIGVGDEKPVISPDDDLTGDNPNGAWFLVEPETSFTLSNVVLDGDTFLVHQAIRSHGDTVISGVDFMNIQGSLSGSPYRGIAVSSYGGTVAGGGGSDSHSGGGSPSTLTVTDSTFEQIGRIGVLVKGNGSTATISGNTYTGKGDGDFLDYAFEVGAGGNAVIESNTITGNRGVAATDGSTSAGILVTTYFGNGTMATITDNNIANNTSGLTLGYDEFDTSTAVVSDNTFGDNDFQVEVTSDDVDIDLESTFTGNIFDRAVVVRENPIVVTMIFSSIQDAIDAASEGHIIDVASGTYDEQLIVDVDLTIQGAGSSTIIKPSQATADGFTLFSRSTSMALNSAPILVTGDNATDVTVKDMQIDGSLVSSVPAGASGFFGILFRGANGLIDSVTVRDINGVLGQGDNAIYISPMGEVVSVEVANSNVFDYGKNGITGNFDGLTVDIHDNSVTGVGATPSIAQNGVQIGFGAIGTITDNTVSDNVWTGTYGGTNDPATDSEADGSTGILLYMPGSSEIEISGNTLAGNQFGVWTVAAPSVNIHDNDITGLAHTGNAFPTGVAIWSADMWTDDFGGTEQSTSGSVTDNTMSNHDYGLVIRDYDAGSAAAPSVEVHLSSIADSELFGAWSNATLDATLNYWGSATGPFHATENPEGLGDEVSDNVEFKQYYIDAGLTTLSSENQVVADDEVEVDSDNPEVVIPEDLDETTISVPSTVTDATINVAALVTSSDGTKNATLPKLNINADTTVGTVQIAIPNGTKITAANSWDGTINVPTIKLASSVTVTPSDEDVEVDEVLTVIEIGFDDVALEFDTGVRILIPDMAGNLVGYSRAGTFTPITNVCSADSQAAGNALPDGGDCKIDAGDDLVVWTKHFTSFVVYSEAPIATDEDGGPSGGGSRPPVIISWPPVTTLPESHFLEFPLERIQVASSAFLNAAGLGIAEARVGQQVSIASTFTNNQETAQGYAFIVQVIDENDLTTSIDWQESMIGSGSTAEVSVLWTPEADGTYTIKIFVWDGISLAPQPLSQVTVKNLKVTA